MQYVSGRYSRVANLAMNLGVSEMVSHLCLKHRRIEKLLNLDLYVLRSQYAKYPLRCRAKSSDRDVFRQIFLHREYSCLDDVAKVGLVIDCGANCGYSAAYFLSRWPESFVVAVEPDAENFRILEDNLRPYGGRYTAVKSGVWSHSTGLVVEPNSDFGDGREWARTVREARSDETPDVQATDIGRLLRESGHERISILKIDIEGSERNVFANGTPDWIDKVDNMVIELHGKDCEDVVHPAMAGQGFAVSRCDELTVFKRPR